MATIRAKCNKYGNWIVYVGSEKFPMNDSKGQTAYKLFELMEAGHALSDKSEITADDMVRFVDSGFNYLSI